MFGDYKIIEFKTIKGVDLNSLVFILVNWEIVDGKYLKINIRIFTFHFIEIF